jgi:hypothetical protein
MSIYDITIAGTAGAAPADGFIDPKTVYAYGNDTSPTKPTSYAKSLAKSRANRRHKSVVGMVQFYSGMQITNVTLGGSPTADAPASNIVYRIEIADVNAVVTKDENNAGAILTGVPAIRRIFARALAKAETVLLDVLDPTTATAPGNTTSYARAGTRFNIETVGALYANVTAAEAGVTVTLVP